MKVWKQGYHSEEIDAPVLLSVLKEFQISTETSPSHMWKKPLPVLVLQFKKKAEPSSEDNHSGGITCILLFGEVQSQVST